MISQKKRRIAILSESYFGDLEAKTASGLIRYKPEEVVAVIDSTKVGRSVREVLGFGGEIPIVKDLEASLKFGPNALLIGIAPRGGKLPAEWRNQVKQALENGLDVISGLHDMLNEDSELSMIALLKKAKIWDLREARQFNKVAVVDPSLIEAKVVLTVGTDCKVGKMIAAIEIAKEAKNSDWNPFFAATGQTGMVITGSGVPIDSIIGDFMSGALEEFLIEKSKSHDLLLVEGQGTLIHPGYSGVSLALIHGCLPDAMILCHFPGRKKIKNYDIVIPPLPDLIKLHEQVAKPVKACKVTGICLNTQQLTEEEAKQEIKKVEAETGLPVTDPVRFGCKGLVRALEFLRN